MKKLFAALVLLSATLAFAANPKVSMETSHGTIEIELDEAKAPKTVANFLKYVESKHYDGTIFHRVIDGFMIQGGGFTEGMNEKKTNPPIVNEASNRLKNDTGTIAMARTMDPNSATAQFFINVNNNDPLNYTDSNPGYAVFGKVTKGMDVVNRIKKVRTGSMMGHENVPMDTVLIKSVKKI